MTNENTMSVDDIPETPRGNSSRYFMIDIGQGNERYKVDRECDVTAVVVPYVTSCHPTKKPGELHYFRDYFRYRNLGADKKQFYFDCMQSFGERCPITDAMKAVGAKVKSQRMALMNIYVVSIDKVPVNKMFVMDHSFATFLQELRTAAMDKSDRIGQENVKFFMDPNKGSYVQWKWKKDTMPGGNAFFKASTFDFAPHNGLNGLLKDLITQAVDLDKSLRKLSYDEAKARFIDGMAMGPDDTSEPAKPAQEKAKPSDDAVAKAQAAATDPSAFDANWE